MVSFDQFQRLPTDEVARLVRASGSKVCVFPINGTRRWFMLEHLSEEGEELATLYLDVSGRSHIDLYRMLFAHGLDTLLTPVFGPDLVDRGEQYLGVAAEGLSRLAIHPEFLTFYESHGVRVRFYGDYQEFFRATPYAYLSELFEEVTAKTARHNRYRLFFGVCAQDATERVAELAVQYHGEHGRVPDKRTLVELYYGEYVEGADLFIGFDRFTVFDMPLIATGEEDLYFTVCPSLYLSEGQLRGILYDHLYARRGGEPDYSAMSAQDWAYMREFYRANMARTMGIGVKREPSGVWYPLPQVEMPDSLESVL